MGLPGGSAAARRGRPALPAASPTPAWTGKTSISRVRARTRRTCCCGAASSRLPPACRACFRQRCHAAGVDKLQGRQINDYLRVAGRNHRRDTHGICFVKLPAQRDDNATAAFAGTQIHTDHGGRFPASAARQGLDPAASSPVFHHRHYAGYRPLSRQGDAPLTAVPGGPAAAARHAIRWSLPAGVTALPGTPGRMVTRGPPRGLSARSELRRIRVSAAGVSAVAGRPVPKRPRPAAWPHLKWMGGAAGSGGRHRGHNGVSS